MFGAALAFVAFALVLDHQPPDHPWSFAALAVTIFYPFTKRFFLDAAGGAGRGLQLRHPDGSSPRPPAAAPALAGAADRQPVLGAYDTEYAMVDRDDDLKIGIRTSAITLGADVGGVMLFYAAFLAVWAGSGRARLGAGPTFAGSPWPASIAGWHYTLIRTRTREGCFRAFRLNHWVGFCGVRRRG